MKLADLTMTKPAIVNSVYSEDFAKEARKNHPQSRDEKIRNEGAFWYFSLLSHSVSHFGFTYMEETADQQLIQAAESLHNLHTEVCKGRRSGLPRDMQCREQGS